MMNRIFALSNKIGERYNVSLVKPFLVLNTLFWGIISLLVCSVFVLAGAFPETGPIKLLIIFIGYGVTVPGMFGGIIYLMRRDIRDYTENIY